MNFGIYDENRKLIDRLEQSVKDGRVSHAYLFEGPGNVDKLDFAKSFIKGVLCPPQISPQARGENCGRCELCEKIDHDNHEDIIYIQKDGKSIKDSAIIQMQERLKVKPLRGKNIAIICDSDLMTDRAQNRLLKTLEEPLGDAMIILLSENMENLASTILSRCVKFRIDATSQTAEDESAETLIRMALEGRKFHELVHEAGDDLKDRIKAGQLLDSMERVYREMLFTEHKDIQTYKPEEICRYIECIEEARARIDQKMSAEYAMKELLLEITA